MPVAGDIPNWVLGTAQLGRPYGIANRSGKPDLEEALKIIQTAVANGVWVFDTAQAYGESEKVLGVCFRELGISSKVRVVSKIAPKNHGSSREDLLASIETSIRTLGVKKLYGLLLHDGSLLHSWKDFYQPLFEILKKKGWIDFAGVSVYEEEEVEKALGMDGIDWIQLPFNIFDPRAFKNRWFERARAFGKHIFVRSIFLQGLLLLKPDQIPSTLSFAVPFLKRYEEFCRQWSLSQKEMAATFVLKNAKGASVVFGAESERQVAENIGLFSKLGSGDFSEKMVFNPEGIPENLINPSLWPSVW